MLRAAIALRHHQDNSGNTKDYQQGTLDQRALLLQRVRRRPIDCRGIQYSTKYRGQTCWYSWRRCWTPNTSIAIQIERFSLLARLRTLTMRVTCVHACMYINHNTEIPKRTKQRMRHPMAIRRCQLWHESMQSVARHVYTLNDDQ